MALCNGIRVRVWKLGNAGGYKVEKVEFFTSVIILNLGLGQPFECAYNEAERLAVTVDAELMLEDELLRKSRTGEYK